jgi:hypothetical protein
VNGRFGAFDLPFVTAFFALVGNDSLVVADSHGHRRALLDMARRALRIVRRGFAHTDQSFGGGVGNDTLLMSFVKSDKFLRCRYWRGGFTPQERCSYVRRSEFVSRSVSWMANKWHRFQLH